MTRWRRSWRTVATPAREQGRSRFSPAAACRRVGSGGISLLLLSGRISAFTTGRQAGMRSWRRSSNRKMQCRRRTGSPASVALRHRAYVGASRAAAGQWRVDRTRGAATSGVCFRQRTAAPAGKATVDVGEAGKGFIIETVNARVVDLGTRFGVAVGRRTKPTSWCSRARSRCSIP